MGLTRTGALVVLGCVGAAVLAWLFGLPEVATLAAAGLVMVGVAVVWVRAGSPRLVIARAARPPRLEIGERCEIRLVTRNPHRRHSPVITLEDRVGRHGTARLVLAPLAPGDRSVATYSQPTARRGLHHVGPLTTTVEDPFGLARRSRRDEQILSVIVLPRTWHLSTMPAAPGDEPEHGTHALTSASTVDEEFAALRDYVPGDDVRRIHWRSTARRGAPVVRQFDVPWQRRTTVLLDLRAGIDEAAFERAVSAAASVVQLVSRRDELVRLVTTSGADSGFVPAAEQLDELLDRLAVVTVDPPRRDRDAQPAGRRRHRPTRDLHRRAASGRRRRHGCSDARAGPARRGRHRTRRTPGARHRHRPGPPRRRGRPCCDLGARCPLRIAEGAHGAVSHPPAADTPRRVALAGAEAGLLVLALGVAASFTRLFVDWGWLGRLAVPVVAA